MAVNAFVRRMHISVCNALIRRNILMELSMPTPPLKCVPATGGSKPPSNTELYGPTRVCPPPQMASCVCNTASYTFIHRSCYERCVKQRDASIQPACVDQKSKPTFNCQRHPVSILPETDWSSLTIVCLRAGCTNVVYLRT